LDGCVARLGQGLVRALDDAGAGGGGTLLLENTAGAGGTVGRTFEELARIIDSAGGDPRIGVCLDTQHLWASGLAFGRSGDADTLVRSLHRRVGLERLGCLHLNDSKVAFGANRDRHENLGEGTMGPAPLEALLGQPRLQGLPAVLEVPGIDDRGPGLADLAVARRLHRAGLALRTTPAGTSEPL
jgi:deoxyribonuclease-4